MMKYAPLAVVAGLLFMTLFGFVNGAGAPGGGPSLLRAAPRIPAGDLKLVIIVNQANPIVNLSVAELRRVFRGEPSVWATGRKITIVMREPGNRDRQIALRHIYRMNEQEFARYFLEGTARRKVRNPPKILASTVGVLRFVYNVTGAIGYVRSDEIDESVKVLHIDGHAPGDAGYPLKIGSNE